eukprot:g14801.t1
MAPRRVLDVTADGDAVGAEGWNHPMAPDDESAAFLMFATGQQVGAVARASEATALEPRLQKRPTPLRKGSRPGSECPEQLEDLRAHLCVNGFRHAEAESNTRWQRFLVWRVRADPFLLALDKFWKDNSIGVKAVVESDKCGGMEGLVEMEKQDKENKMKRRNAFVVKIAIELFDDIKVEMAEKAGYIAWRSVDPTAHQIALDHFIGTPDGEPADGHSLCATLDGLCWSSQGRLKKAKSYIRN